MPHSEPSGGMAETRLRVAIAAAFLLLVTAALAVAVMSVRSADAERSVTHTVEVRENTQTLLSSVRAAVSAERGYVLLGDRRILQAIDVARRDIPVQLDRLFVLTRDNRLAHARLKRLRTLVDQRMQALSRTVALASIGRSADALSEVRAGVGPAYLGEIRDLVYAMDGDEAKLLIQRRQAAGVERMILMSTAIIALAMAGALAFLVNTTLSRYTARLVAQNRNLANEIAGRETVEAQLRQSQKMEALGQLTGGIAHDFNNMLAVISGSLQLLRRRLDAADSRTVALLDSALEGADRGAALTRRLLAFTRQQALEPKPADVNRIIGDMSNLLRRTLSEPVTVETVLAGGLWWAEVDVAQLENVLLNLSLNARDAMGGRGRLTIETANAFLDEAYVAGEDEVKVGQYVMIAVTDTGCGMSREVADKAFDPFFTTKAVGQGTGLGLSQVLGFIKQSYGHVKLYSEVGVGTTVKLYLPRAPQRIVADEPVPARDSAPIAVQLKGAAVLLVEDEPGVRAFVADALHELGCQVSVAPDAGEALRYLNGDSTIDLMLTDIVMPDMNGRILADRAQSLRPNLRVVFMTGYTRNAIVHNGVLDAGVHLLTKPFTLDQLAAKLEEALSSPSP